MLSTGPAVVGGAIAASVAGPRASVWVRVRGAGAVVEARSGSDEDGSVGSLAGSIGSGSDVVAGEGAIEESALSDTGCRARTSEVCGSVLSSTGAVVGVTSVELSVATAAGASGDCESMLGLQCVVLPPQHFR